MRSPFEDSVIGPDGKRYFRSEGGIPEDADKPPPNVVYVYGDPEEGSTIVWQNGKAQWVAP